MQGPIMDTGITSYSLACNQRFIFDLSTAQSNSTGTNVTSHPVAVGSAFALWDNPEDLISHKVERWVSLVNGLFLIPLFTLLGVPGNIVSAVVFYRQGLRARINLCLFALAIVDAIVVLVLFLPYFESQLRSLLFPHAWFLTTYLPGLAGFVWASHFLSAVIASERCFCVVSPFHAKRLLKTSTMAAIIVVGSSVLVGGMCAIVGPKHTIINLVDPVTNTSRATFYVTRYYLDNQAVIDDFDIFFYATSLPGIFLFVIILATSVTIVALQSFVSQRNVLTFANDKEKNSNTISAHCLSRKEVAVTRMLIGTSALFIVCVTPNFVGQVTAFLVPDLSFRGKLYNTNMIMWAIIQLLRVINSSVTVCIYYLMGSKFRQLFHELCPCFGNKKPIRMKCSIERNTPATVSVIRG